MTTARQIIEVMSKCPVLAPSTDNLKQLEIDPSKKTDIEQRAARLYNRLRQLGTGMADPRALSQETINQINANNIQRAMTVAESAALKPGSGRGMAGMLARDFAIVRDWLGMGDKYTELGWVRESLNRTRRAYRGGISDAFRRHQFAERIDQLQSAVLETLKKRGLRDDQIRYITTEAVEKGFYPILRQTQNTGTRATAYLDAEYGRFFNELTNTYGLSAKEAQDILGTGEKAAYLYHYAAGIAHDAGVAVSETEAWGYFPRIMSDQAQRRLNWKWEDENKVRWNTGETVAPTEGFLKSRTTTQFIVEDEMMLDYILRNLGRQKGDVNYYFKVGAPDVEGAGIADILDSRYGLSQVVGSVLENHHPEVVEALLDSHLLSKVPYSTVEVYKYIRDTLRMPFDNLDEVFQVDWRLGMETYRHQLEKAAEQSGFVNKLVAEAVNGNWGVGSITRLTDPAYQDFVPLKQVIMPNILAKSFQASNPGIGDVYVHPVVAQMAKAAQELQMSPYTMGIFARITRQMNRKFRQLVLATFEYIPRQLWQNMISLGAAGGDMLKFPVNTSRLILYNLIEQVSPGNGMKVFDNKRRIYKLGDGRMLTEAELYNHLHDVGFLTRYEPLTGNAPTTGYNATTLRESPATWAKSMRRNARYLRHALASEGIGRATEELASQVGDVFDSATFPIAFSNTLLNNAAAFTAVESMSRVYNVGAPEHFLRAAGRTPSGTTFKAFDTVDEALQHAQDYFFFYDDLTYYDRMIRNHVIPFWGFFSKNIPAAVRYAVRHPSRFIAHQRLYSLANLPVMGDENLTESSVPGWTLDQSPVFFKVPGGRPDGRDAYFVIPLESVDPIRSGLRWVTDPAVSLMEAMGIWRDHSIKTTGERLSEQPRMDTQTNRVLTDYMKKLFPLWQAGIQTVMGETFDDTPLDEGATVDEFLGVRMAPSVRLWLEALLPILGTVNRYNPGNFRGTATTYDPNTGLWTPGTPSWAGVPMSGRDSFHQNNPYTMFQYAGIKIYPVDTAINMGQSYDQLRISLREGRKYVQKMKEDLSRIEEGSSLYQQRQYEIAQMEYVISETQKDMLKLEAYMQQHGYDPGQAYNALRRSNTRVGDLP